MLNFSASNVVSWPTPQSTAVPAVTPITPVQPAPGAGRDAQAGLGFDQKRQSAQQSKDGSSPQGAPKLPRDADASAPAQSTQSREAEAVAQRAAREASAREIEQRASEKEAIHQHLREVLSNVWQASAAVVDRALGRDAAAELPGPSSGSSSALAAVAASLTGRRPVLLAPESLSAPVVQALPAPDTSDALSGAKQIQTMTDVVAYDERGNGTVTPHEAGSLVDQRV
ncbi:hypothetical protein [Hydrogenophaga sp.]|uniref:hypothetical protein n=1 Tax=Hydrogenophaga sp. TaxID=1904254 RepID=UPI002715E671|nr:hypothetical protein [Hydrogenophaga sp.]MDO8906140.1 hypothetical protein [Hydrogenophaga sp.]